MDASEVNGDNSQFAEMIDGGARAADGAEESKVQGKKKREKNIIDFRESVIFYEDSEGDFNVISEDEDLADANTYALQHKAKALKTTIVPKQFYEDIRAEQANNDLN